VPGYFFGETAMKAKLLNQASLYAKAACVAAVYFAALAAVGG
jgi:hypothetical protein